MFLKAFSKKFQTTNLFMTISSFYRSSSRFIALTVLLAICALSSLAPSATAQSSSENRWDGEWVAEGTLFRIGVVVVNNVMQVTQIESMGQLWTNEDGEVDGNIVRVKVDYAGASGIIQAELVDNETAIAFAASCLPEFMVVCALSKDREAVFRKVSD